MLIKTNKVFNLKPYYIDTPITLTLSKRECKYKSNWCYNKEENRLYIWYGQFNQIHFGEIDKLNLSKLNQQFKNGESKVLTNYDESEYFVIIAGKLIKFDFEKIKNDVLNTIKNETERNT